MPEMAPNLHQILDHLSHLVVSQFLFVWVIVLAGIVFCGLVATRPGGAAAPGEAKRNPSIWPTPRGAKLAKLAVLGFLLACAILTLLRENIHDYDNAMLWAVLALLLSFCALVASDGRHPIYGALWREETKNGTPMLRWSGSRADWTAATGLLLLLLC